MVHEIHNLNSMNYKSLKMKRVIFLDYVASVDRLNY